MVISRLGLDGYGVSRTGSFAGKAAAGQHPVGIITRLSVDGYGARPGGSFAGKSSGVEHPVGLLTRLGPDGYPHKRLGDFSGKALNAPAFQGIPRPGGGPFWHKYARGEKVRRSDEDEDYDAEVPQQPEPAPRPLVKVGQPEPARIVFSPLPPTPKFVQPLPLPKRDKLVAKSTDQTENDEDMMMLLVAML